MISWDLFYFSYLFFSFSFINDAVNAANNDHVDAYAACDFIKDAHNEDLHCLFVWQSSMRVWYCYDS